MTEKTSYTNVLQIPNDTKYWFVRAGTNASFYQDFKFNNYIAIGDNSVTSEELFGIETEYATTDETLKIQYKQIYQSNLKNEYLRNTEKLDIPADKIKSDLITLTRRATNSASKGFNFVEKMSVGDLVIVPSKNSTHFLIGVLTSPVFDEPISHIYLGEDNEYTICQYIKKRRILWLKEILFSDLPNKLAWIKNGHQTIFNITKNANEINPLLSNKFVYKNLYFERFGVSTKKAITESDFFNLQSVLHDAVNQNSTSKVFQTIDIQSPGDVILHTAIDNWPAISTFGAILFGKAKIPTPIGEINIQGIVPYFSKESRLNRKINIKTKEMELQSIEDSSKRKKELAEVELEKARTEANLKSEELKQARVTTKKAEQSIQATMAIDKLEKEAVTKTTNVSPININQSQEQSDSLTSMQINQNEIGSVTSFETQTDILSFRQVKSPQE
ncbi:hypothetical protein ACT5YT_03335 [Leuconostoc suionicum]|uniref:hypothetical protein n=1 Tax=Leuconostoc suionicum TaxID=1511761 RepID=UPI00403584E9